MLQAWLSVEQLATSELVLVTRRAIATRPDESEVDVVQAGLWGMVRTAQLEYGERSLVLVDIEDEADLAALPAALALGEPVPGRSACFDDLCVHQQAVRAAGPRATRVASNRRGRSGPSAGRSGRDMARQSRLGDRRSVANRAGRHGSAAAGVRDSEDVEHVVREHSVGVAASKDCGPATGNSVAVPSHGVVAHAHVRDRAEDLEWRQLEVAGCRRLARKVLIDDQVVLRD